MASNISQHLAIAVQVQQRNQLYGPASLTTITWSCFPAFRSWSGADWHFKFGGAVKHCIRYSGQVGKNHPMFNFFSRCWECWAQKGQSLCRKGSCQIWVKFRACWHLQPSWTQASHLKFARSLSRTKTDTESLTCPILGPLIGLE